MTIDHDTRNRMPALFIGHDSPRSALEDNRYSAAWRSLAETIGWPRAVLAIPAHWYMNAAAVTAPEPLIAGPVHGPTSMTSFVLADHPTVVHDDNPKGATHG